MVQRLTYEAPGELSCPLANTSPIEDDIVLSTNWEYLESMKMNPHAPAANMTPITRPGTKEEGKRFVPWFWPDAELAPSVKIRQAAFLNNQSHVLKTGNNDPVIRAAAQQLLWLQSTYLTEHFPDIYRLEQSQKFGRVIVNQMTDDQFSVRPGKRDWHPLAISGMLGQEDICLVQRKKSGRQVLVAGFLATPTNWNLSYFMNADMDTIHRHVKGYHKPAAADSRYRLKDTVDKVMESLREYPDNVIARNNQFIEYNPQLALEPDTEFDMDRQHIAQDPGDAIFLRTERETLTRLPAPYDDFTVFTIKPNVFRMSDIRDNRGSDFVRALATNAVLRSALRSNKKAREADKFDFTELLESYLSTSDSTASL